MIKMDVMVTTISSRDRDSALAAGEDYCDTNEYWEFDFERVTRKWSWAEFKFIRTYEVHLMKRDFKIVRL